MCVTFIISSRTPFYQIINYRDTPAFILDPCIQEFFKLMLKAKHFQAHVRVRISFTLEFLAPLRNSCQSLHQSVSASDSRL